MRQGMAAQQAWATLVARLGKHSSLFLQLVSLSAELVLTVLQFAEQ